MTNTQVIRNLKDVAVVAQKMFKCALQRITDEVHAKGYMGVKIIVGEKSNPAFDPNADPNKPGLSAAEIQFEKNKQLVRVPDLRIIWIRPGMTVQELIVEHLNGIKKSLEIRTPIIDPSITTLSGPRTQKSDVELAAMVAKGENPAAELTGFDDEVDEVGYDGDEIKTETDNEEEQEIEEEVGGVKEPGEKSETSEVLKALNTINKNIETLSDDIGKVNEFAMGLEARIASVENKKTTKRK